MEFQSNDLAERSKPVTEDSEWRGLGAREPDQGRQDAAGHVLSVLEDQSSLEERRIAWVGSWSRNYSHGNLERIDEIGVVDPGDAGWLQRVGGVPVCLDDFHSNMLRGR